MPKKLAVAVMAVMTALAILIPVGTANAGTQNVGTSACYVTVDYWEVDVKVTPTPPFVHVSYWGTVGAGVHCPLNPPPIQDLIAWG